MSFILGINCDGFRFCWYKISLILRVLKFICIENFILVVYIMCVRYMIYFVFFRWLDSERWSCFEIVFFVKEKYEKFDGGYLLVDFVCLLLVVLVILEDMV